MLVVILAVAAFFRFYKLLVLQYYSFDDEVATMFMYNLVANKKLILAGTTATLDIPLGAWWYWLSAPLFAITKFDPSKILAFGSVVGVAATYAVFVVGKTLGNRRIGLMASLLYAGSFMTALLDRRWWALSLDPLLMLVAIVSFYKLVAGNFKYIIPLTGVVAFGWQLDPTLGMVGLAVAIGLLVFRIKLNLKTLLPAILIIILSLLPLVVLELRHPGAVTTSYSRLMSRTSQAGGIRPGNQLTADALVLGLSRAFWAKPTATVENYMFPGSASEHLDFNWGLKLVALLLILGPILLITNPNKPNLGIKVLYLFLVAFLAGIIMVNQLAKIHISQHYYSVIWPVVFLLAGFSLNWLREKNQKAIVVGFLGLFLIINLWALMNSRMRYPLDQKVKLMNLITDNLEAKAFSFYPLEDIHLYGGGLGGILAARDLFPSNRNYYGFDWTYQAFSLYQVPVVDEDKFDQRVVVYPEWITPDWTVYEEVVLVQQFQVANMKAAILRPPQPVQ